MTIKAITNRIRYWTNNLRVSSIIMAVWGPLMISIQMIKKYIWDQRASDKGCIMILQEVRIMLLRIVWTLILLKVLLRRRWLSRGRLEIVWYRYLRVLRKVNQKIIFRWHPKANSLCIWLSISPQISSFLFWTSQINKIR